jgi:hypothetical protein
MRKIIDANQVLSHSDLLTAEELRVIDLLAYAWNAFMTLDAVHPEDQNEFRMAIHSAQKIVMARPVQYELQKNL